jgi:hypothetical protein
MVFFTSVTLYFLAAVVSAAVVVALVVWGAAVVAGWVWAASVHPSVDGAAVSSMETGAVVSPVTISILVPEVFWLSAALPSSSNWSLSASAAVVPLITIPSPLPQAVMLNVVIAATKINHFFLIYLFLHAILHLSQSIIPTIIHDL